MTAPEVPHADLIARLRRDLAELDDLRPASLFAQIIAALGDTVTTVGVRQEPTWVFTCPVEFCNLYEAGFDDQWEADKALYEHIDERHN